MTTDAAKFLVDNYVDRSATTLSVPTNQIIEASLAYLQRFDWRLQSRIAGTTVNFRFNFGSALPVSAFAFKGTNMRNGATVTLKYGSTDNGTLFNTTAATITLFSPTVRANGLPLTYAHGAFFNAAITKQYWDVTCTDSGHPSNALSLGRVFLGPSLEFERADEQPLSVNLGATMQITDNTTVETSAAGSPHATRLPTSRDYTFDLLQMTADSAVELEEIQEQFGRSVPVWLFPYPNDALLRYRKAVYGYFINFGSSQPQRAEVFNASQITLREV